MDSNSLSQDTEIDLLIQLIPYLENKYFVDIGAEKGFFALTLLQNNLSGILFEPMPKHFNALNDLTSKFSNSKYFTYAISNEDSTQQFNVATDSAGNELDYYHSLLKADAPGVFAHSKSFQVQCRSLNSLVKSNEIKSEIGILKTDTEGNDLNVLRGLGKITPELIICEYFSTGLYNGWTEGGPDLIIEYMRNLGYSTFLATKRIGGLEFVTLGSTLFQEKQWGNLFFFRNDFYYKVKTEVDKFVFKNEIELFNKFNNLNTALEEKEKVIQQLLRERNLVITQKTHSKKWFSRLLGLNHNN